MDITIPKRPYFKEVPNPELLGLIGKPINSPEMKDFIKKHGGKYPSIDTISTNNKPVKGRTLIQIEEQYFEVLLNSSPMAALEFGLLNTGIFSPIASNKKDEYYPILTGMLIVNNMINGEVCLPKGISSSSSLEMLMDKLGEPNERTGVSWSWNILLENDSILMFLQYRKEESICGIVDEIIITINPDKTHI